MTVSNACVDILKRGAAAWKQWRAASDKDVVDLRGLNIGGLQLPGIDLSRCNLHGADLSGCNLEGADLRHSDFVRARLYRTILRKADLHGANLRGAFLANAQLDNADLRHCNLLGANLQGASLKRANLQFAIFANCILAGVDFRDAVCGGTVFSGTDLTSSRNLTSVMHSRASSLGVDVLKTWHRDFPVAFVRGCGIEDDIVAFFKTGQAVETTHYYSCFISYSHKDKQFAVRLHDALQDVGVRCWLDEKRMRPGDDIYDEVERGIREHEKILLCASQHSLTSWWVDAEIQSAFEKERAIMQDTGRRWLVLIPLNLDDYMFKDEPPNGKSKIIRSRFAADFRDPEKFKHEVNKLVQALRRDR